CGRGRPGAAAVLRDRGARCGHADADRAGNAGDPGDGDGHLLACLAAFYGQVELLPLAPGAGVELRLASGEREPVDDDAGGDAGAAVGDERAFRQSGERLVPGCASRSGDPARDTVDRVRLAAKASGWA